MKETTAMFAPPLTTVGAERTAFAVIEEDADDTVLAVPFPLGVTVNVYEVPFVNPPTVHDWVEVLAIAVVLETVQVKFPGFEVATYVVAVPSGQKVTVTAPLPALATVGVVMALPKVTPPDAATPVVSPVTSVLTVKPPATKDCAVAGFVKPPSLILSVLSAAQFVVVVHPVSLVKVTT